MTSTVDFYLGAGAGARTHSIPVDSARVTQLRGQCAIIEIATSYPAGGVLALGAWGTLVVDGITAATGRVSGYPIGLSGDAITIECVCRATNHDDLVEALYAPHNSVIPHEIEKLGRPARERVEPYLPYDVHVPPAAPGAPELVYIGTDDPATSARRPVSLTLRGEGAGPLQSQIFGLRVDLAEPPLLAVDVEIEASWEQIEASMIRVADMSVKTFTPDELVAQLESAAISGGGYSLIAPQGYRASVSEMSVDYETLVIRRGYTDPLSGIRWPSITKLMETRDVTPDLGVIVKAQQPRREVVKIRVGSNVKDVGAARAVETQRLTAFGLDQRVRQTARLGYALRYFDVTKIPETVLSSTAARPTLRAGVLRAIRMIVDRAFCIEISAEVPADIARSSALHDVVRIEDARLPGGVATGFVTAVDYSYADEDLGTIRVACAATTSLASSATPPGDVASDLVLAGAEGADPATTVLLEAVKSANSSYFDQSEIREGTDFDAQVGRIQEMSEVGVIRYNPTEGGASDTGATGVFDAWQQAYASIPVTEIDIKLRQIERPSETLEMTWLATAQTVLVTNGVNYD